MSNTTSIKASVYEQEKEEQKWALKEMEANGKEYCNIGDFTKGAKRLSQVKIQPDTSDENFHTNQTGYYLLSSKYECVNKIGKDIPVQRIQMMGEHTKSQYFKETLTVKSKRFKGNMASVDAEEVLCKILPD